MVQHLIGAVVAALLLSGCGNKEEKPQTAQTEVQQTSEQAEAEEERPQLELQDSLDTVAGKLELRGSEMEMRFEMYLDGKMVTNWSDYPYVRIADFQHFKGADTLMILTDAGGKMTASYEFYVLKKDAAPVMLPISHAYGEDLFPKRSGEELTIDLGYHDGVHQLLVYRQGAASIQNHPEDAAKPAEEADCRFLYEDIYKAYLDDGGVGPENRPCMQGDEPKYVTGMATARPYNALATDPRVNLKAFDALAKSSCQSGVVMVYEAFKKEVCGY